MVKKAATANRKSKLIGKVVIGFVVLVLVNVLSDSIYQRFDLTKEKRYTLSESTKSLIDKLDEEVYITLFLDGELPLEYKRLKSATRDMMNEYRLQSSGLINYKFDDILAEKELKEKEQILQELYQKGLRIEKPETKPDEAPTEKFIIPAGVVFYKAKNIH